MRFCLSALLGLALIHPAAATGQELSYKITAIIKQLDLNSGTVTVRPTRKDATADETFSFLKKDIDVKNPSGEKTQLGELKIGQTVQLTIGVNGDIEAVNIQALAFLATVEDVDLAKRTVKITQNENQLLTMLVPNDAKLSIAGRSVFLRELKIGAEFRVEASLDAKTVLGLNLVFDPDGKHASKLYTRIKVSRLPGTRFVGVLTDIDAAKNQFNLTGPKTKYAPRRMTVAKDAILQSIYWQVSMQEVSLKEIDKGARATLLVSAEDQVTRVVLDPPTQRAKVKSLDGNAGRLTVNVDGRDKTYELQRGVKVMSGSRVRRLADLEPNLPVNLIFSLDRQQLLAVDVR